MRANERTDERVAQYLRLDSCLFQTTVRWRQNRERGEAEAKRDEIRDGWTDRKTDRKKSFMSSWTKKERSHLVKVSGAMGVGSGGDGNVEWYMG